MADASEISPQAAASVSCEYGVDRWKVLIMAFLGIGDIGH
jgi:hypothetical protein